MTNPADDAEAPGHTDLMVSPESIEAFLEANPLPEDHPMSDSTDISDAAQNIAFTAFSDARDQFIRDHPGLLDLDKTVRYALASALSAARPHLVTDRGEPSEARVEAIVDYVLRFGRNCRDCADADGTCPNSGMPCDPDVCRVVIQHTIKAMRYGVEHGFLSAARPHLAGQPKDEVHEFIAAVKLLEDAGWRVVRKSEPDAKALGSDDLLVLTASDALAPAAGQADETVEESIDHHAYRVAHIPEPKRSAAGQPVEIKGLAAEIAEAVMGNDHLMHLLDQQQRDSVQHDIEIEAGRVLRRAAIPERVNAVGLKELTLADCLKLWREHGGKTFGPHVEHVSMKESDFLGFCVALAHLPRDRKGETDADIERRVVMDEGGE